MAVEVSEMLAEIAQAQALGVLEALRVAYVGRNGEVTERLKSVGKLTRARRLMPSECRLRLP